MTNPEPEDTEESVIVITEHPEEMPFEEDDDYWDEYEDKNDE